MKRAIHLIGFGSQGSAWAQALRTSGWDVHVYLARESASYLRAKELGFQPKLIQQLTQDLKSHPSSALVAMLCPDHLIAPIYGDFIAQVTTPVTLVLAHGYAIYSNDLKTSSAQHHVSLLAPKAIGPKLLAAFQKAHPAAHPLSAAFYAEPKQRTELEALASGLGFAKDHLIAASFDQEAIGDLISEQGLLCGGVFTLLEWTMTAMRKAGIPEALIHEECITELELIAGLLKERGPAATFRAISQAAQAGTIAMQERLNDAGMHAAFDQQVQQVVSKEFVEFFKKGEWRAKAKDLEERFK